MRRLVIMMATVLATAWAVAEDDIPVVTGRGADEELVAAVVPLRSLDFEEVQPLLEGMVSPEGTVGYLAQRRAVVLYDQRRNVEKMKALLAQIDRHPVNVRVDIVYNNERLLTDTGVDIGFGRDGGPPKVVIEDGKVRWPDRVEIGARHNRRRETEDRRQFLVARSGHPARLHIGKQIGEAEWLNRYRLVPLRGGKPLLWQDSVGKIKYRDIGSFLYMTAIAREDGLIEVEVFPAIIVRDQAGRRHEFRVWQVETKVVVAPGRSMPIAGNDEDMNRYLFQLFGPDLWGRQRQQNTLGITLSATIQEPPRQR